MIHITDGKTDRILSIIDETEFWEDKHTKSLKDTLETFDFTTFADKHFSEYLAKRNRVIIPDEDGKYIEFIIENTRKFHGADGLFIEVYTSASFIELSKSKVIEPQTTPSWTAKQHAEMALSGTEWAVGTVDFAGSRTITIESYTNPYSYLKQIASEFNLELHFRVETDGNKVTRRYVDLIEHVGGWNGREVEFGKDLMGIERKEDFSNIVTALVGIGPERDDGTRLQVFVEDKDALARWGRNGKHLIDVYEPDSSDSNMTLERLRSLTEAELAKRINSTVEYTGDVVDLEKVPGLEHEKFRLGDTIRIKDTAFTPPLYLEARIHTVERSIKQNGQKTVTLGDYIEYTEEDVFAIYKRLQAEIAKKVSLSKVMEVTYTKEEIDTKDTNVKIEAAQDATNKAQQAEESAKQYTETYAEKKIYRGLAPPLNPIEGEFWLDENTNPPIWRKWDGQNWVKITRESFEDLKGILKSHQIEDGAITAAKIAADAVVAQAIAAGAVLAEHINVDSLSAISADLGTITAGEMIGVVIKTSQTADIEGIVLSGTQLKSNSATYGSNLTIDNGSVKVDDINNYHSEVAADSISFGRSTTSGASIFYYEPGDGSFGELTIYSRDYITMDAKEIRTLNTETGFCGVGGVTTGITGPIAGVGVNFRTKKTYTPSSISLSGTSHNLILSTHLHAIDISPDGFWLYIDGGDTNNAYRYWRGYYTA